MEINIVTTQISKLYRFTDRGQTIALNENEVYDVLKKSLNVSSGAEQESFKDLFATFMRMPESVKKRFLNQTFLD